LKGHRWFQGGCSCGPTGHVPRKRKGKATKQKDFATVEAVRNEYSGWRRKMRRMPCFYCGEPGGTIDHILPKSEGGKMLPENSVPACSGCNIFRGNRDFDWFREIGWKLRPFSGIQDEIRESK
jgi:5-methylcytosine-specific restriction endonuclease McrA